MNESVADRIRLYIKANNLKTKHFEQAAGLTNGYIRSLKTVPGSAKIEAILAAYPDLDREWLMTGKGLAPVLIEEKVTAEERISSCPDNSSNNLIMENRRLFDLLERQQDQTREALEQNKRLIGIIERMQDSIRSVEQKGDMAV